MEQLQESKIDQTEQREVVLRINDYKHLEDTIFNTDQLYDLKNLNTTDDKQHQ